MLQNEYLAQLDDDLLTFFFSLSLFFSSFLFFLLPFRGNPGAVLEKVIDVLPEVARELSKPLQKTENMVFVCDGGQHGGSENMSIEDLDDSSGGYEWGDPVNDFTKLVAELPETVGAIADVDLVAAFENLLSGRSGDAIVQGAAEGTATGLVDLLFARS